MRVPTADGAARQLVYHMVTSSAMPACKTAHSARRGTNYVANDVKPHRFKDFHSFLGKTGLVDQSFSNVLSKCSRPTSELPESPKSTKW